jgi:general secretion pathway protein H
VRARGFTLVEVLVVVMLVGIVAAIASLGIGDGGGRERVDREFERFEQLVHFAGTEAVLRGRPIGARVESDRYRFYLHVDREWQPFERDPLLGERRLRANVVTVLPDTTALSPQGPVLVFYPDRTATPLRVRFASRTESYSRTLSIDATGATSPAAGTGS